MPRVYTPGIGFRDAGGQEAVGRRRARLLGPAKGGRFGEARFWSRQAPKSTVSVSAEGMFFFFFYLCARVSGWAGAYILVSFSWLPYDRWRF